MIAGGDKMCRYLIASAVACMIAATVHSNGRDHHEYCIIGAGPGGLQLAYFLHRAGRDYIVYEKGNTAGTFYTKYPIHRTLISINKRHTGKTNKEFNFRHDWNSLISDDKTLLLGKYSKELFPHANELVQYLKDFAKKLNISVQYNSTIGDIRPRDQKSGLFHINDQNGRKYTCNIITVATGMAKPKLPEREALRNLTIGYHELSTDLDDFEGKSVLILGRGNSGFETAQYIMGRTNYIHMFARSRVKLAWSTHYVGDLRAVNNGLLDTYQLKSLDGVVTGHTAYIHAMRKNDGRLYVARRKADTGHSPSCRVENFALREGYDMIITCLGFMFDPSIFNESVDFQYKNEKYPRMSLQYESRDIPGIYYAGVTTHVLDHKRSAGGFIHGFRYSSRTLHRIFENKYHNIQWPHVKFPSALHAIPHLIKRINEGSDIYQMFGVLCDFMIFSKVSGEVIYVPAFPCALTPQFVEVSGHAVPGKLVVLALEYGKNFSDPAADVFSPHRAFPSPRLAHKSNFLHPVLYYYSDRPTVAQFSHRPEKWILPIPDRIHHIAEDFTTVFDAPRVHVLGVRRFLEYIVEKDLRQFYVRQCMIICLLSTTVPESCILYDFKGEGMSIRGEQSELLAEMKPWVLGGHGLQLKRFL